MSKEKSSAALGILLCLATAHLLNDLLQAVLSASYPILKEELQLSFSEIGVVTLVYQIAASVFQPVVGVVFYRHPVSHSLWFSTTFTTIGIAGLALSPSLFTLLPSVVIIGLGS